MKIASHNQGARRAQSFRIAQCGSVRGSVHWRRRLAHVGIGAKVVCPRVVDVLEYILLSSER